MNAFYGSHHSWRVAMRIRHLGVEILLDVQTPLLIGCAPLSAPALPDVNLIGLVGDKCDVSERHVMIGLETSGLYLIDQGAPQGTIVNDVRLQPYEAHAVRNGDILKIGSLEVQLFMIENPVG